MCLKILVRPLARKQILLLLVSTFAVFNSPLNAQQVKGWEVVPPPPEAANLGKYGNVPVGLHTGIPEISIPLHTIKSKTLQLPLSINYHASGHKVSEIASWTGLGWTLFAGGSISVSAVGLGDDGGMGFLDRNNNQNASQIDSDDLEFLMQVTSGLTDNESDLYFLNLPEVSAKFVLDNNRKAFLIPEQPIDISFNYRSRGFDVTSEDGTKYFFNSKETVTAGAYTPSGQDGHSYTGAYYLTKIISTDGTDSIEFIYQQAELFTENFTSYVEVIGDRCNNSGVDAAQHDYNQSHSFRTTQYLRLTEIRFLDGKVELVRVADRVDGPPSRLSEIRVLQKNFAGAYALQKSILFQTSYFASGAARRLKLEKLLFRDALNKDIKSYAFSYNESELLPHRQHFGQDWWGYYNGKNSSSSSLVSSEIINFGGRNYQVGSANRSPDSVYMKACMLTKITYPTGGFTEFFYEPHFFEGSSKIVRRVDAASGEMQNTTDLLEKTVQFTTNRFGYAKVSTQCSNVIDAEPYFSRVFLRKVDGKSLLEHYFDPYNYPQYPPELAKEFTVFLEPGTYELTVRSKGNSQSSLYFGAAYSKASVVWEDYDSTNPPVMAGGLRVRKIVDFSDAGSVAAERIFKYGMGENGKGVLITPQNKVGSYKETKQVRYWGTTGSLCHVTCQTSRRFIHASTPQDLTSFNGATVVYPEVAVYEKAPSAPNGKRVSRFTVEEDEIYPASSGYRDGVILLNNGWKGGDEIWNADFVGSTTDRSKEVSRSFGLLKNSQITGTKIGRVYSETGSCGPLYYDITAYSNFYYFDYPIRSGVKKLSSNREIVFSSLNPANSITTQVIYAYDNLSSKHQQLSRQETLKSDGSRHCTYYWYPADYGSTDNLSQLVEKNIVNTPVKIETRKDDVLIAGEINRLNSDGKTYEVYQYRAETPELPPPHDPGVLVPDKYEKTLQIGYDGLTKNIANVKKVDDYNTAYVWGYNHALPVAMAVNANPSDIAYTSFEPDAKGNWSYSGAIFNDIPAKTGEGYYKLANGHIYKTLNPGIYILEYWSKGPVILSGGIITELNTSSPDPNGWIYYQKKVSIQSATGLFISGTTAIDELRIYPSGCAMTSYTYDRHTGVTSISDPNNVMKFFKYDSFGRLEWVRDFDKNIVEAYQHHFKGMASAALNNHIKSTQIKQPGITTQSLLNNYNLETHQENYEYFDGLGRLEQSVKKEASPLKYDLVQPISYDAFGREAVKYLPYTVNERNGFFKTDFIAKSHADYSSPALSPQFRFYQEQAKVANDPQPYSETVFEASPANRVIKQGSAGQVWQPDQEDHYDSDDHTIKFAYETNSLDDKVIVWSLNTSDAGSPELIYVDEEGIRYYQPGQLFKNKSKDESGHEILEYKDKEGRVVLKRVQALTGNVEVNDIHYASTYYIYDDFGNLVAVLQPEAVKSLTGNQN